MEKDAERGLEWAALPVIATLALLLCPYATEPALSKNSSGSQDARGAYLVVFSPLVHTPAMRGIEDGEGRQ